MTTVKDKIKNLLKALCTDLYEREEAIKLALLSAVAGESIFLLGPPGVGKSLIARRLKYAFSEGKSFEYLMTKFSTPDEVFGPISIKKLKDEDKYERKTTGYLPGANIVFLDEIWKSGSAIQNALLTVLNEKIYKNGEVEEKVNIHAIVAASNELPPKGESFEPLWDRMLLRYPIENIKKKENFLKMILSTKDVYEPDIDILFQINNQELTTWSDAIDNIEVTEVVLNTIQVIRQKIISFNEKPGNKSLALHAYDRRWKKIIRLLRTSAFLNGRISVDLMDCFLIVHCLWNVPEQYPIIKEIVAETIRKHGYSLSINLPLMKREIEDFENEIAEEILVKHTIAEDVLIPFKDEYYELIKLQDYFRGSFIEVKAFNKLTIGDELVTNFYDENLNLVNRLDVRKNGNLNTLEIKHNSTWYNIKLKTQQKEKVKLIYKKPHRLIKAHWDKRFDELTTYLDEQEQFIVSNKPTELEASDFNLFIDSRLSGIVKSNLEEVAKTLKNLRLQLDKAKHSYEQLH